MKRPRFSLYVVAFALAFLVAGSLAMGGRVFQQASDPFGWVGTALQLDYVFENVATHEQPVLPDVPGLTITSAGVPSTFQRSRTINGQRTSQTTLTYRFLVSADAPGHYEIPAFTLHADDQEFTTEPFPLEFRDSADSSLLRAQIRGMPEHIWLGDAIPAVLRISIKPYADPLLSEGTMSATDMWRQVNPDASQWGAFREAVVRIYGQNSYPPARIVNVPDQAGATQRWYAFDIPTVIQPDRVGSIDFSDVRIAMSYPMQLTRQRGSLFDPLPSLGVTHARPVTAVPEPLTAIVAEPPTTGRPQSWAGAVGRFTFDVEASPTQATVGEPITLRMRITDVGTHQADMDLLQAPLLDADGALTAHFRVPDERPGGIVQDDAKVFTQSIRAMSTEPTVIPPIAFSFFDPAQARYETVFSRPIPISVGSSRTVDAEDLGATTPVVVEPAEVEGLTAVRGGLLANYTDPRLLLASSPLPGAWWLLAILLVPPLAFLLAVGVQDRLAAERGDPSRRRARRARRMLQTRLAESDGAPDAVAAALRSYIADRLGLPEGGLTRSEAVAAIPGETSSALDARLADLEHRAYAGSAGRLSQQDLDEVRNLADTLEGATR